MRRFGVSLMQEGWSSFVVPKGSYSTPGEIRVEGDALGVLLPRGGASAGDVRVEAGRSSIQGDIRFTEVLEKMGRRSRWRRWIESAHRLEETESH